MIAFAYIVGVIVTFVGIGWFSDRTDWSTRDLTLAGAAAFLFPITIVAAVCVALYSAFLEIVEGSRPEPEEPRVWRCEESGHRSRSASPPRCSCHNEEMVEE